MEVLNGSDVLFVNSVDQFTFPEAVWLVYLLTILFIHNRSSSNPAEGLISVFKWSEINFNAILFEFE